MAGVKLTCRDTFLTKAEYLQLLFTALDGLEGTEIVGSVDDILFPPPALPKTPAGPRWTGKQVVTGLLQNLIRAPAPPLNLLGKTRTPPTAFGENNHEHMIVIRCSELLAGVVDKASIGSTSMGLVHSVYELHGSRQAGLLLNAFARLFTYYLRDAGHTCGLEDLVLTQAADADRVRLLKEVESAAGRGLQEFIAEQGLSTGETGGNKNLEG